MKYLLLAALMLSLVGCYSEEEYERAKKQTAIRSERGAMAMFPGGKVLGTVCYGSQGCMVTIEYKGEVYTYDNIYQLEVRKLSEVAE